MAKGKFVSYLRVSTDKQGRSGLGLEAQREAVRRYLNGGNWDLVAEFVEVQSGKRDERPQLAKALEAVRRAKATLIVAKLDRVSRKLHYITGLIEAKVDFIVAEVPNADRMILQMYGVLGEFEGRRISERTKDALAAAKRRGRKLGWSNPSRRDEQAEAAAKGAAANAEAAVAFAANVMPVIRSIRSAGANTLAEVAVALNNRGIRTARGGQWYPMTVRNIEMRADA